MTTLGGRGVDVATTMKASQRLYFYAASSKSRATSMSRMPTRRHPGIRIHAYEETCKRGSNGFDDGLALTDGRGMICSNRLLVSYLRQEYVSCVIVPSVSKRSTRSISSPAESDGYSNIRPPSVATSSACEESEPSLVVISLVQVASSLVVVALTGHVHVTCSGNLAQINEPLCLERVARRVRSRLHSLHALNVGFPCVFNTTEDYFGLPWYIGFVIQ